MIEPYQALGLVPTMRGIRHRGEISVNIEHITHLIKAASWLYRPATPSSPAGSSTSGSRCPPAAR